MAASALSAVPLIVQFLSPMEPEQERILLSACSLAHEHGDCTTVATGHSHPLNATVDATSPDRVLLEVSGIQQHRDVFASREVSFQPQDDPNERARSVGLALGVLATSLTSSVSEPELSSAQERTPPNDERSIPARRDPLYPPPLFVGVALGAEFFPSWMKLGPSVQGHVTVQPLRLLSLELRLNGTFLGGQGSTPRITALSPHLRAGVVLPLERSIFMFHGFVGIEHLSARVESLDEEGQKGSRTAGAVGLSGTLGLALGEGGWSFLSPSLTAVLSPTEIFVDERSTGTLGTLRAGLHAGIAWGRIQGEEKSRAGRQ